MDTGNHQLLVSFCDQLGRVVGCSLGSEEEITGKPVHVFTPATGTLMVKGCGVDAEVEVRTLADSGFKFTGEPIPFGQPGGCWMDLVMVYRLPENWKSGGVEIQNLRGRIFLERRAAGSQAAALTIAGRAGSGLIPFITRADEMLLAGAPESTVQIDLGEEDSGQYRLGGCGLELRGSFTGRTLRLDLAELWPGGIPLKGSCLIFGWAVGSAGLDRSLSLGVTVFRKDDTALAGSAWLEKGKVCYEAQPYVSFVTWGEKRSNELKGCFEMKGEGILTMVTAAGRAAYAHVTTGGVEWLK